MGTKSKEIQEDPRLLKMLSRMGEQLAILEDLPKTVAALNNRLSSLEGQAVKETSMPESPESCGNILTKEETKIMENETIMLLP